MKVVVIRETDVCDISHARVIAALKTAKRTATGYPKPTRELTIAIYCAATQASEADAKFWFGLAEKDGVISDADFHTPEVLH